MEEVIRFLLSLEKEGLVKGYALAGAFALYFYMEPVQTSDVDFFIYYTEKTGSFIDMRPLYNSARAKGYSEENEHIIIGGIAVQLLTVSNDLEKEAVEEAVEKDYGEMKVRVPPLEYLMAIMVSVGRPKDRERIAKIIEDDIKFDRETLYRILEKHNLKEKWEKIIGQAR
jgi:hypothetical protein